eukprot:4111369-Pyramimonas_sp.AAC.1
MSLAEKGLAGMVTPQGSDRERITLVLRRAIPHERHAIAIMTATSLLLLASEHRSLIFFRTV